MSIDATSSTHPVVRTGSDSMTAQYLARAQGQPDQSQVSATAEGASQRPYPGASVSAPPAPPGQGLSVDKSA